MIIRTSLNPGYYKLAKEALKGYGKKIAIARTEKDIDTVIKLITSAKNVSCTFKNNIANAKRYTTNNDSTGFQWL